MPKLTTATMSLLTLAFTLCAACSSTPTVSKNKASSDLEVVHFSDINWIPLIPALGDNSPKSGTLWGDRAANTATGFLVQFNDGFSSPPHIHNVSYRGIVLSGLVHNDDPNAAKMWMPAGSYWTQPQGEPHITAAQGSMNMAYIEIDSGPYLVHPTDQAYDNGERPINVDASNIVWLNTTANTQIAHLWGNDAQGQPNGVLVKLPKDFSGYISSNSAHTNAVVIQGQLLVHNPNQSNPESLQTGCAFESHSAFNIKVSNTAHQDSIIYIRSEGTLTISDN